MTSDEAAAEGRDPYLLAQVREAFGRVVYSHKTQEKQADICFHRHRWQQGILIALTAISSGTFLAALVGALGSPVLTSLATSFIAILVSATSLATNVQVLGGSRRAPRHRNTALGCPRVLSVPDRRPDVRYDVSVRCPRKAG